MDKHGSAVVMPEPQHSLRYTIFPHMIQVWCCVFCWFPPAVVMTIPFFFNDLGLKRVPVQPSE
jgi:hypothetical protein